MLPTWPEIRKRPQDIRPGLRLAACNTKGLEGRITELHYIVDRDELQAGIAWDDGTTSTGYEDDWSVYLKHMSGIDL